MKFKYSIRLGFCTTMSYSQRLRTDTVASKQCVPNIVPKKKEKGSSGNSLAQYSLWVNGLTKPRWILIAT